MHRYDKFMLIGMYIAAVSDALIAAGVWLWLVNGGL